MNRRIHAAGRLVAMALAVFGLHAPALAAQETSEGTAGGNLGKLDSLQGTWVAEGNGFSSTLSYDWALPGALFRARNEVRDATGTLLARYEGHYAWDEGSRSLVFWTVSEGGELHRGEARWMGDRLWHGATVSGGGIEGYRSVIEIRDGRLLYRAVYESGASDGEVLESEALVYTRRSSPGR